MGVYEYEEVRDGGAEGERVREMCPGMGVCVEDDGEEGGWSSCSTFSILFQEVKKDGGELGRTFIFLLFTICAVDGVHGRLFSPSPGLLESFVF